MAAPTDASANSVDLDNKNPVALTPTTSEEDALAYEGVKTRRSRQRTSLGLAAYIYSLDGSTTYTYLSYAASAFEDHTLMSTIQVAQSINIAVGKPVIAKVADVTSCGLAYTVVCYIVIASSKNIETVAGGIILYAIGYTGLQLLTQIIIADITSLKWRGLVSSLISMPFIINAFVGANVSASVIKHAGWRWGFFTAKGNQSPEIAVTGSSTPRTSVAASLETTLTISCQPPSPLRQSIPLDVSSYPDKEKLEA